MSEDILKLGYSEEIVKHVINQRLESDEIPFQDSGELLQAVMKEEEITELENKRSSQFEKSSVSSETVRGETNGPEKQSECTIPFNRLLKHLFLNHIIWNENWFFFVG